MCGQEIFMAFQCSYCGGHFCAAHRLPENHNCPKLDVARDQRQKEADALSRRITYEHKVTFGQPPQAKKRVYFSPREIKHLTIAVLLVIAVGLLTVLYSGATLQAGLPVSVVAFTVILTVSFFAHEMAHKITAERKGIWAEFRLTLWGSIVTLIFAFLPIKLIAPGAVMIAGPASKEDMGKISMAGPMTNIVLSIVFFGAAVVPSSLIPFFLFGGFFNAYIAAFNLIPYGAFDGLKIFNWNKTVWGLVFATSAALTVIGYILYVPYLQ
ncbi:MAG TPA: AN1-type zinc finger domain-containing protein [candidate division Zixibacteria bacterium]|nr:AN1-type zinc finger domain-containing protein [candidate division Zixibacteria bacterium]